MNRNPCQTDPDDWVTRVREYWCETHDDYMRDVGPTFQGGYLGSGNPTVSARESNIRLAELAGIVPGTVVLDAGCGVCGPCIDIAGAIPSVHFVGITISPEQAVSARQLIRLAGLDTSIRVMVGDYHRLPVRTATFDFVWFIESAIYAMDLNLTFAEAFRILRPGGRLYMKDVFQRHGNLSARARGELDEFDRTWVCRARPMSEYAQAAERAGFVDVTVCDISPYISAAHVTHAMFHAGDPRSGVTSFGRRHFRLYWELPTLFGEIKASKPR